MEENFIVLVRGSEVQSTIERVHDIPAQLEALEVSNRDFSQLKKMLDRQFLREFS